MEKKPLRLATQTILIMTEFNSESKTISCNNRKIFDLLSDLSNLEKMRDSIPAEKIKDFSFDRDSCSFSIAPLGKIAFSVVDREPHHTIRLKADSSPVEVNLAVNLIEIGPEVTELKLTVNANLNPFIKPMVSKPLQDGLNKIAEVLAAVPYDLYT